MAKLTDLHVHFISLVQRPANGKDLTLKSDRGAPVMFEIRKTIDEQMRAYGIVYAPGEEDAQGDHTDAPTILRAANEFMREGRLKNVDLEHGFDPAEAFVAESWIVRSGDPLFGDEPDGAWAVGIQITDPNLWRAVKSGEYTGLSLAGYARTAEEDDPPELETREKTDPNQPPGWFRRWLNTLKGDDPMSLTEDDVRRLARETAEEVLAKSQSAAGGGQDGGDGGNAGAGDNGGGSEDLTATIEQAVAKAVDERLEAKLDERLPEALAKGSRETDGGTSGQESFV